MAANVSVTSMKSGGDPSSPTLTSPLVDVVTITKADYNAGTLTVEATSSHEVTPLPTLTVNGTTLTPTGTGAVQTGTIIGLTIPPATITVTSDKGGTDTEQVDVVNP